MFFTRTGLRSCSSFVALMVAMPLYAMDISFSGYGTAAVGSVIGNDDEPIVVDYLANGTYDSEIRFEPETLIAVRGTAAINEKLSATFQLTGKGAQKNAAVFEWGYASYKLTPETTVNMGRFRLPLFYYSDFIDTGYAYHWVRPPTNVYGLPVSTITGINLVNTHYFGALGLTSQVWYGAEKADEEDIVADITKSQGINLMIEYDWLRFRYVYHTLTLGIDPKALIAQTPGGLIQIDPDPFFNDIKYQSAALMVDYNAWLFRSEYTHIDTEGLEEGAYASIGYLIGDFTPHITQSYRKTAEKRDTQIIGVRWDFTPGAALKFEYSNEHYKTDGGETLFGYIPPKEKRTELFVIALDFVF